MMVTGCIHWIKLNSRKILKKKRDKVVHGTSIGFFLLLYFFLLDTFGNFFTE